MPKCSAFGSLNDAAARCAEVEFTIGRIKSSVSLGGVAKAVFPNSEATPLEDLNPDSPLSLQWESAFFYGENSVWGPITATLRPDNSTVNLEQSFVQPVTPETEVDRSFFPALSRNFFHFRFDMSRLGLSFTTTQPIINEAVINTIPPFNVTYNLVGRNTLELLRSNSGFMRRVTPPVVLESCRVKLMELRDVRVALQILRQGDNEISFEATVTNETTERKITATWLIWPRPELPVRQSLGVFTIERGRPHRFRFTVPRDIFLSNDGLLCQ
jgi:hypothetical protein